jgi:hypothetical protein
MYQNKTFARKHTQTVIANNSGVRRIVHIRYARCCRTVNAARQGALCRRGAPTAVVVGSHWRAAGVWYDTTPTAVAATGGMRPTRSKARRNNGGLTLDVDRIEGQGHLDV